MTQVRIGPGAYAIGAAHPASRRCAPPQRLRAVAHQVAATAESIAYDVSGLATSLCSVMYASARRL